MDVTQFESELKKPPLTPVSFSAFQTLTHQIEYTPADFLAYMTQGSNASYSVNKKKIGASTYGYSIITLTGGYISTVVSNQTTMGGNAMEFPKIPEPVKNVAMHAVSGFLLGFSATFVVAPGSWAELSTAIYGASVIGFYGAIKEVAAYVSTLTNKNTKADNSKEVPKPLLKRML